MRVRACACTCTYMYVRDSRMLTSIDTSHACMQHMFHSSIRPKALSCITVMREYYDSVSCGTSNAVHVHVHKAYIVCMYDHVCVYMCVVWGFVVQASSV